MVLSESEIYGIGAVIAGLFLVLSVVLLRGFRGRQKKHALPFALLGGLFIIGYAGMSQGLFAPKTADGYPVHLLRYLIYIIGYGFTAGYAGLVAGAAFRYRVAVIGAVIGNSLATVGGQLLPGSLGSLFSLFSLVTLIFALWVLLGPLTKASKHVSGQRHLLFSKLRNITLLAFLTYFVIGLLARGTTGILDTFMSVFVTGYADVMIFGGIILITLTSPEAFEAMADEYDSPLQVFVRGVSNE